MGVQHQLFLLQETSHTNCTGITDSEKPGKEKHKPGEPGKMTASSPSAQFQLMLSPAEQLSWSPKLPGTGCLPDCDTSLKGKHLTDANPVAFNCASLPSRSQPFLVLTGLFFRSTESTVGVNFSSRHTFLVPQDTQPWTSLFRDPELLLLYEQVVRKPNTVLSLDTFWRRTILRWFSSFGVK